MRTLIYSICAGLVLSTASVALADKIIIKPEVGSQFQQFVVKEKVKPFKFEGDVVVGATLPPDIELLPVPETIITASPDLESYDYVVIGDRIAIVEPQTRRIVTFVR